MVKLNDMNSVYTFLTKAKYVITHNIGVNIILGIAYLLLGFWIFFEHSEISSKAAIVYALIGIVYVWLAIKSKQTKDQK